MRIFTIGFTKKTAEEFFNRGSLRREMTRLIDVRLRCFAAGRFLEARRSALFSKSNLQHRLCASARACPHAGNAETNTEKYRKASHDWEAYAVGSWRSLRRETWRARWIGNVQGLVLLCSEAEAYHCHRRLAAEYLRDRWGDVEIVHL